MRFAFPFQELTPSKQIQDLARPGCAPFVPVASFLRVVGAAPGPAPLLALRQLCAETSEASACGINPLAALDLIGPGFALASPVHVVFSVLQVRFAALFILFRRPLPISDSAFAEEQRYGENCGCQKQEDRGSFAVEDCQHEQQSGCREQQQGPAPTDGFHGSIYMVEGDCLLRLLFWRSDVSGAESPKW
jgi:hypothetical protein